MVYSPAISLGCWWHSRLGIVKVGDIIAVPYDAMTDGKLNYPVRLFRASTKPITRMLTLPTGPESAKLLGDNAVLRPTLNGYFAPDPPAEYRAIYWGPGLRDSGDKDHRYRYWFAVHVGPDRARMLQVGIEKARELYTSLPRKLAPLEHEPPQRDPIVVAISLQRETFERHQEARRQNPWTWGEELEQFQPGCPGGLTR